MSRFRLAIVALILTLKWGGQKFLGASLGHKPNRAVELVARNPIGPKQSVLQSLFRGRSQ